jgi:D-amino-acid dehydrogenase
MFYADSRAVILERAAGVHDVAPDDAKALFPVLGDVRAALIHPAAARVDGRRFSAALCASARARGLEVSRSGAERLVMTCDRVTGVSTGDGDFAAGMVVIAGGAWSKAFEEQTRARFPVRPLRGQIVHLRVEAQDTTTWPIVQPALSHYLVPWPDGRVAIGGTVEEAGFDPRITAAGLRELLREGLRTAPGLKDASFVEARVGLRPLSEDDLPVLGPVPGIEGLHVATGHGANGLLLGPYSGALVAAAALGEPPAIDLTPFSGSRFG